MKNHFLPLLFATALLTACGGQGGAAQDEHDHAAEGAPGTEVALTPEQIKAIGLVTGTMEKRGLTTSLRANGRPDVAHAVRTGRASSP